MEPKVAEAIARASRPDYERWAAMVEASRCCAQPVRLSGRVLEEDPDSGRLDVVYSTGGEADGVLLKACGTRRASRCPGCASLYRFDAKAILAAGLDADDEDPGSPVVYATLTAPSFGPVHRATSSPGPCHPRRTDARCGHGTPMSCRIIHDDRDPMVGTALCLDCYDYEAAVLFNARVGELWHRTVIAAGRHLASLAGLSKRQFPRHWRLSFAKVVEFQARGVVHIHALVRLDRLDDGIGSLGEADLVSALAAAAAGTVAPDPIDPTKPIAWGSQCDIRPVPPRAVRWPPPIWPSTRPRASTPAGSSTTACTGLCPSGST